ncbi:hypothetical protein SUGI_1141560 [Cryptomeria japonica]|uniref:auxin-responsive protein SAUR71 n=1 Tax=Cryptomeria japonica TaxID=3369 RepID=UPI002414ACA8|nr:auxin-responsive protein SAUR71 [Cryptomeria japonica]GLJ53504.1 hypothetical protein SUGI_1141560 [Cryptomeria japonica]
MRQLIRKLQRVANPPCTSVQLQRPLLGDEEKQKCCGNRKSRERGFRVDVPEGFLPVYVGKDLTRFVINARFLNHPIFAELLQKSAQEYGYEQKGGLKIPCDVVLFEHIIFLLNNDDPAVQNLSLRDMSEFLSY